MSGRIADFNDCGCDVLGISTDDLETHQRWLTTPPAQAGLGQIEFPLAADADGAVCKQYGVYVERQHLAQRGLFIIDPNGVLQYQVVHSLSVGRSSDEVLRVLNALQSGGLCPGERQIGQPTIDVHAVLQPNRVVGQYEIETEIGSGAFGTVFRARDQLLDRTVALKVLRSGKSVSTQLLLAEARAAAALNHPNVCAVYSVDTSNGVTMIVMEYVAGEPLSVKLSAGPLMNDTAAEYIRQIARGMAAAHAAGVVHGDLKPANLMVTRDDTIKIMDFGLARRFTPRLDYAETMQLESSTSSGLSGTPGYMSPELTRGDPPTPASDVFALGLTIYEMVTGQPAVSGTILDVLRQIEQFDVSSYLPKVPNQFTHIVQESLVANEADRQITMAQIVEHLS